MDKTKIKIRDLLPYIAFAIVVIYLFYHLINMLFPSAELYLVKKETYAENVTLDGYIFRDETLIFADADVKLTRKSGEKIAAGSVVGEIYGDGGAKTADIISERAGYFYAETDGYENSFSADAALALTADNFDATVRAKPSDNNGCIGKIATDFCWYFACKTSGVDFEVGQTYAFDLSGVSVNMTLEKADEKDGASVLVFKCTEIPSGFEFTRASTAAATVGVYSGAAVPSNAVYKKSGGDRIYLFDEGFARECRVNVVFDDGAKCIVECETDLIGRNVIIGRGLYDGKGMK